MIRTERQGVEEFFAYARERETIRLRRQRGLLRPEWTDDPVLQQFRFCNIDREDDKTTAWFRANIRDPLRWEADLVLLATAGFRWFTLIRTGAAIKDILLNEAWNSEKIKERLKDWKPPLVTGAYMMTSPHGYNKLDGICLAMDLLIESGVPEKIAAQPNMSLEEAHKLLMSVEWLGDFRSYEIVTDLRHTCLLENAPDIMTWANPGPGALRGTGWVLVEQPNNTAAFRTRSLNLMRELTRLANDPNAGYWPWKPWEMRTAEHTLCEFDKYCRAKYLGKKLKRRFQ